MSNYTIIRKHEIHTGHRVYGHLGKCQHLHGHSYIIHFHCTATKLNELGMVIDFSIIKNTLCQWLDDNYDHRMLIWQEDPIANNLKAIDSTVTLVPYNPTAENIANYLLNTIAPEILTKNYPDIMITQVLIEETGKCSASAFL